MADEAVPALDLGVLPKAMHADLLALTTQFDPQYARSVDRVMRLACLNPQGEMEDDDVIILGGITEPFLAMLRSAYDQLSASYQVAFDRDLWIDMCAEDGQALGCFAVGKHNDDGVGIQSDRLLLVLKCPDYYRFDAFDEGNKRFEAKIGVGQMIYFDEALDHQLVMLGAPERLESDLFDQEELPESELVYVLNLPSPLLNDA